MLLKEKWLCTKPIHRNNLASNLFISFVVFLFFFSIPTQAEDVSSTTEVFSDQWLFGKQSSDIHPDGGDGFITFADWAVFANAWQSTSEPLSAHWNPQCDIAPDGGDGTVDMLDLARFLKYWLSEGILITSPIPNELWAKGRTYQIEWTTDNPSPTVKVRLFKGETKVLDIKNPTENNGVCNWKVPTNLSKGTNYRVKIVCVDDKTVYGFSNYFEICGRCDLYNEIMVTEPNDNFVWEMGNTYPIRWTGGESNQKVKIQLFKGSTLKKTITDSTANDGLYNYKVPYSLAPSSSYRIKVKVLGSDCSSLVDKSDSFEIEAPKIDVTFPDSDSVWMMGQSALINWDDGDISGDVKIKLYKGSKAVKTLKDSTANDGSYTWSKVSYSLSQGKNYRVKIISRKNSKIYGYSDSFEIAMLPIAVTLPTSDTEWRRGYTHTIRWTGGKPSKEVKIYLLKAGVKVKTIKSSTDNDGSCQWKVPNKLALGSDYSVKVVYLPNTALQDTSDTFSVINSPVGKWDGDWKHGGITKDLKLKVKSDLAFSGSAVVPINKYGVGNVRIPFTGKTSSYDFDTGEFSAISAKGSTVKNGITFTLKLTEIGGYCVNHNMINGTILQVKVTGSQGGYSESEYRNNATFYLTRQIQ